MDSNIETDLASGYRRRMKRARIGGAFLALAPMCVLVTVFLADIFGAELSWTYGEGSVIMLAVLVPTIIGAILLEYSRDH